MSCNSACITHTHTQVSGTIFIEVAVLNSIIRPADLVKSLLLCAKDLWLFVNGVLGENHRCPTIEGKAVFFPSNDVVHLLHTKNHRQGKEEKSPRLCHWSMRRCECKDHLCPKAEKNRYVFILFYFFTTPSRILGRSLGYVSMLNNFPKYGSLWDGPQNGGTYAGFALPDRSQKAPEKQSRSGALSSVASHNHVLSKWGYISDTLMKSPVLTLISLPKSFHTVPLAYFEFQNFILTWH